MLNKIVRLVQLAYGDVLPENAASNSISRATTPEQIITAAVLESMKNDIADWAVYQRQRNYNDYKKESYLYSPLVDFAIWDNMKVYEQSQELAWLWNKKKDIAIRIRVQRGTPYNYLPAEVNGVSIPVDYTLKIIGVYRTFKEAEIKLKQAAARALADMERNEKAWQLAEKLLGMKRNDQGALVPVVDVRKEDPDAVAKATQVTEGIVDVFAENYKDLSHVSNNKRPKGKSGVRSR